MSFADGKFADWYYNTFKKLLKFEDRLQFRQVDFTKPWYFVFFQEKLVLTLTILSEILQAAFSSLTPVILGYIVLNKDIRLLVYFATTYLVLEIINRFISYIYLISLSRIQGSAITSVSSFFLTVDPIYHGTKSSGTIISKSQIMGREFSFMIGGILFSLLPIFSGYFATVITLLKFNFGLGLVAVGFFVLITIFSSSFKYLHSNIFVKKWIKIRDKSFSTNTENLSQNQLIRSTFATGERSKQYNNELKNAFGDRGSMGVNNGVIIFITRVFYILSVLFIGKNILELINNGTLDVIIGSTILIAYTNASYQVLKIGDFVSDITESIININDLWKYINSFGIQTYPVLENDSVAKLIKTEEPTKLSISLNNLHFDYNEKAKVFQGHSLQLEAPKDQQNKLYGIIGPSGTGKTTLISILGGQLNPTSGEVLISGNNIYKVTDSARKNLITLQMQTSTSLRGKLKYNLLFGLPDESYQDDYLMEVLTGVGLWNLFKDKDGLETLIGEGGLNLSGGQRQRLNFAGLYLRAKFFKPSLILIDEPTSSLDEISEQAITKMIIELSQSAMTLVVAHRLKTLDDALAILDSSLIESGKEMQFYNRKELQQLSQYYQDIMEGKAQLEE